MPTIPWAQVKEVVDAVLDLPPQARDSFLNEACPETAVRRYVESLVLSYEQANQFLEEPAAVRYANVIRPAEDTWIGRRVGAYQVEAEIAIGGMGSVYRAVRADDQYKKQVAIKVIRGSIDPRLALSRFKAERQILADLDHPNIARLLEGGSTDDGKPYFVMEYIQGEPLDRYCDDHKLNITQRIELFRTVCSAVQYAHQKLVIHRDIKPGNILVTKDGIAKLLDFGIAKILGPDSSASAADRTMTMVRLLTPEYASPEQWRGDPISTASDVYSLGVVLYVLLTGHNPYKFASNRPDDINRVVTQTEPERPSTAVSRIDANAKDTAAVLTPEIVSASREGTPEKLRRRLAGDLDNIILMALRKEPERRYASVEQFSEDLRRHLAGLPVMARRDTFTYRGGKFVKRHVAGVTAAALVIVSLTVGLLVSLRQARVARLERIRAENRFNDVRHLANSLITGVYDSIEDLPGATGARKLIVEEALHYLDSLSEESQGDISLQRELAAAYKRIGDVQGNPLNANLGDSAGSLKSYQKALEIRKAVFVANRGSVSDAVSLAEAFRLVGGACLLNNQTADAFNNSKQSVQIAESFENSHPKDFSLLKELSQDYTTEASILGGNFNLSNLGDTAAALEVREKGVAIDERIFNASPNDPVAKRAFAVSLARMGDQFQLAGQRRNALENYLRAETIFESLAVTAPGRRSQEALQAIYNRVFFAEHSVGNLPDALVNARKAMEVAQKLHDADPKDLRSRISVVIDYGNLADILSAVGRIEAAKSAVAQAVADVDQLVLANPNNGELPSVQASTYVTRADVFTLAKQYQPALRYYQKALAMFAQIRSQDSDNVDNILQLAGCYEMVGKLYLDNAAPSTAIEMFQRALTLAEPHAESPHPNEEALYTVADAYTGLGDVEAARAVASKPPSARMQHVNQARSWYERSLKTWKQVQEPSLLSPGGYDSIPPSAVKQRVAKLDAVRLEHR